MLKFFAAFAFSLFIYTLPAQLQMSFEMEGLDYHDLHITPVADGSGDILIAGNVKDTLSDQYAMVIKKVSKKGQVLWSKMYGEENGLDSRCLDLAQYGDYLYATGMLDDGTKRSLLLCLIDASNGEELLSKEFVTDIGSQTLGVKAIFTTSDADGDGNRDPGLLIAGITSQCYDVSRNCPENQGILIRTDADLQPIWTRQMGSKLVPDARFDFDFLSNICETPDGYFLTGGTSGADYFGFPQQAVLAHKIDFEGNTLWDNSYIRGNFRDLGADAYFDKKTNSIYTLCNYSIDHCFAITVFNNLTGEMDTLRSWVGAPVDADIDRYGFTLSPHPDDQDILLITGYDRREEWEDDDGNLMESENHLLVYAFDKNTGQQVGESYQFYLPYFSQNSGILDFWRGQFPLFYFPQIGFTQEENGSPYLYSIGYRTGEFSGSNPVIFKTEAGTANKCESNTLSYKVNPIQTSVAEAEIQPVTVLASNKSLFGQDADFALSSCGLPWQPESDDSDCQYLLYPNPTPDVLYLDQPNEVNFQVFDYTGKLMMDGITQNQSINLQNLAAGMYLVNLSSIEEPVCRETLKVVKVGK